MSSEGLITREILTVSELTGRLRDLIEEAFDAVWLVGEISNLRQPSSGHFYFTLKDRQAQVRAVMFRTKRRYLAFDPEDGREVLVRGRLSVYEPRGEYQVVVDYMEPRGEGALRLAFEQLKDRLAQEGLFDQERKKKLPFLPQRVALVTSPTGAAVRDFIHVSRRRFENVGLFVYPVRVQGEEAAGEIARAVSDLNQWGGFDLMVLTRGGGSLEDLWAFNEEVVARAVAASKIPVVSAVGHEVDFTICDFVADLRAPTPSGAAEMIFREKKALASHLQGASRRLSAAMRGLVQLQRERLSHFQTKMGDPGKIVSEFRLTLDERTEFMIRHLQETMAGHHRALVEAESRLGSVNPGVRLTIQRSRLEDHRRTLARTGRQVPRLARERLAGLAGRLGDLNPLAVLERGYALVQRKPDLAALRSSREVAPGDEIRIRLAQGALDASVDEVLE